MGPFNKLVALWAIASMRVLALPTAPETPYFELRSGNSSLSNLMRRAEAVNFNQDYIASGANVQYSPNQGAGSFSINYNTNQDFVVGLGWQPGDSK
jgi:endo-1,4-beta-xylanase